MSYISDNVIPGNHGKVFGTDAKETTDLQNIKNTILKISGVKEVTIDTEVFPIEFTVLTSEVVKVDEIEQHVSALGFHVVPKSIFAL